VAGDQITATADKIFASGEAFIGATSNKETMWPAIAKMILATQVSGLDAGGFPVPGGTRDLIAELRSVLNADGSFGADGIDNIFNHPLAMLALARTDEGVPAQAVTWMIDQQCADTTSVDYGSFGWAECMMADIDSTAMATQALAASGVLATPGSPLSAAKTWLLSQQQADGGFESWGATNTNSTGLAAQTLADSHPSVVTKAQEFIGGLQVTCAVVLDNSPLVDGDVGAIGYDLEAFDTITSQGMSGQRAQAMRTTTQAILGLGGADFFHLTSQGALATTPTATCGQPPNTAEPTTPPTSGPSNAPADPPPAAAPTSPPAGPVAPVAPGAPTYSAPTGGTTSSSGALAVAGLLLIVGVTALGWRLRCCV
jgi:hypothetical protein